MAKNKSKAKKPQQQSKISPERFLREKARKLPIGKCYITPDWQENGLAHIIVTRIRPDGKYAAVGFLTDTYCLGVKDTLYHTDFTASELEEFLDRFRKRIGLEEISYNEAHNIIYGAVSFAEEGGIEPDKSFDIAQYILEEDTDDVPLIEYEFGYNGKHYLVSGISGKEKRYIKTLRENLGDDFEYTCEADFEDLDYDDDYDDDELDVDFERGMSNWRKMMEESNRHPEEAYAYQYPEYPASPKVKNQFIADELLSPNNVPTLPESIIKRILALPADEAAEDISNVVMYEIGRTYKAINDDTIDNTDNNALIHALLLLIELKSSKGLGAILEIMRQNNEFSEYHLGDWGFDLIYPALYVCGKDNVPEIEAFIHQPGMLSYRRTDAVDALAMIAHRHPERRQEVIEILRRMLNAMVTNLPKQYACDGHFAGNVMATLEDIKAVELIPEIKAVFATDCVDKSAAGDCDKVIACIKDEKDIVNARKFDIPDINAEYSTLQSCYDRDKE